MGTLEIPLFLPVARSVSSSISLRTASKSEYTRPLQCRNSAHSTIQKSYCNSNIKLLVYSNWNYSKWRPWYTVHAAQSSVNISNCRQYIQPDILNPPLLRLTSSKPLWLDLQPADIKSRWRHNWKSAQVVNSHLVCDPTIRQPGFDLPQQQWSLLNRFRMEQGHCGASRRKWRLTDTNLCPCGETQTMSHMVESCPLTKLNGGLSRLHSANEDAVSWLTNYG